MTTPHIAIVKNEIITQSGTIPPGKKLHGIWLMNGFFYFPQTVGENTFVVSVAGQDDVKPIGDENERDSE